MLHSKQRQSTAFKQQLSKEEPEDLISKVSSKKSKQKKVNTKELCRVLPGLRSYHKPGTEEINGFVDDMDPRKPRNRMFLFLLYCFCIVVNFISLTIKQDGGNVYLMNKQVELFTFIHGTHEDGTK